MTGQERRQDAYRRLHRAQWTALIMGLIILVSALATQLDYSKVPYKFWGSTAECHASHICP